MALPDTGIVWATNTSTAWNITPNYLSQAITPRMSRVIIAYNNALGSFQSVQTAVQYQRDWRLQRY